MCQKHDASVIVVAICELLSMTIVLHHLTELESIHCKTNIVCGGDKTIGVVLIIATLYPIAVVFSGCGYMMHVAVQRSA